MSEMIMHKPSGVKISDELLAKIKKEYTGLEVYYFYRTAGDSKKWFYSEKGMKLAESDLLNQDYESVIYFNKSTYMSSLPNPVDILKTDDSCFITCGVGLFPFLIAQNDRGPEVMFDNFLKFLDIPSLHAFLANMCKNYRINYVVTTNYAPARRYGNWNEIEGAYFSDASFYYKIDYAAKAFLKHVLAFFSNPAEPKEELARLDKLSDLSLRQECEKIPNLPETLSKF